VPGSDRRTGRNRSGAVHRNPGPRAVQDQVRLTARWHRGQLPPSDDRSTVVIASGKHRPGQIQKSPHQIEPIGRHVPRHLIDNRPALRFHIVAQQFPVCRSTQERDRAIPDLLGDLSGTLRTSQCQAQPPFGRRIFTSLISRNSSASLAAPRASRLPAFSVFFGAIAAYAEGW
jgi:hypothetical protein